MAQDLVAFLLTVCDLFLVWGLRSIKGLCCRGLDIQRLPESSALEFL